MAYDVEDRAHSVAEVARMLSVDEETIRRWIKKGDLEKLNLPGATIRIPATEVRRLLAPAANVDLTE